MECRTVLEHAQALKEKDYSSVELTHALLEKSQSCANLNAFITLTSEQALKQARQADKLIGKGEGGPLTGIPLVHKDLFCTKGVRTTCGSRILDNFISPYDATLVGKLQQSGMVMLGKVNMDEFAMGSSTENSYYGPTLNPWNHERVPGGSSGGSAAVVAARITPVATGTDTGGSIRQPAALCGLSGIKPSYGRVSRYGMVAFASSLDQGGVMALTAEDCSYILQAMSGFDEKDSTSINQPVPDYIDGLSESISGKVIGLPKEFFSDGVDKEVIQATLDSITLLEKLGAKTIDIDLPNSAAGIPCYYVLAPAEASSNLSRFDGVRYGHRASEYTDINEMYEATRTEGFGPEVKRRLLIGAYVLSVGYFEAYYIKAQKLRRLIADDFSRAFKKCDLIVGPTTPTTAFPIGLKTNDPVQMYLNDIFTNSANLAGLPAMSIPSGFDAQGLPIGLHLIGRYLDEATILNVAHQYQLNTDWHQRIPTGYT
ncbi:MAG: Asp-tRNA(Asn)/Glu-tRNA(Gln) amidotransferase subunit GatA [Gammaproteobacteria bacterium]|nr:Asp-tRNA(Asn)/Glu-tRNA(Gln) amidotransferase subunit GatA [Gammaproteobacteria bacterium]MCY4218561.1 Asp-tRNA(Asn)/Glu-tRNA(Gln) amidotransferase subunit GatA [Gammaproteobacteria bacterium]MCY4274775.1 Asp-tRNA(Asn)/Glu-tRNA(Gln) amidotransferase subunit GatA [Gammaproteobacteria bacterium]